MEYRIFIYSSESNIVSLAMVKNTKKEWNRHYDDNGHCILLEFDIDIIKKKIKKKLGSTCSVCIKYPPHKYKQVGYLCVDTTFEYAKEVVKELYIICLKSNLKMYDATGRKNMDFAICREEFIDITLRERQIYEIIRNSFENTNCFVVGYNKIQKRRACGHEIKAYCISLELRDCSDEKACVRECIERLYSGLKNALVEGEELKCNDKGFAIEGKHYHLSYCIEYCKLYKNWFLAYYDSNEKKVCVDELERDSVYDSIRLVKNQYKWDKKNINLRMAFREMIERYKNIADRYVASVNITKQLNDEVWDIGYGKRRYAVEFCYGYSEDSFYEHYYYTASTLEVYQHHADLLNAFIYDIYPYLGSRYWVDESNIPAEMFSDIIDHLVDVREWFLDKSKYNKIYPYLGRLFRVGTVYYALEEDEKENAEEIKKHMEEEPLEYIYERRDVIVRLLDIFIDWAKIQIDLYGDCHSEYFIKGPG